MLNAENWCIKVHEKVYGPYPSQVLRRYAREGRLAAWSLVAPAGSRQWREAGKEAAFVSLFSDQGDERGGPEAAGDAAFGRRHDDPHAQAERAAKAAKLRANQAEKARTRSAAHRAAASDGDANGGPRKSSKLRRRAAEDEAPTRPVRRGPRRARPIGQFSDAPDAPSGDAAKFVIIFDVISAAATKIAGPIQELGPAYRIAENVWSLACGSTANGVRNALAPHLRPNEPIFVVDATNGRTAWQNFAPQAHAKIAELFSVAKR